MKEGVGWLEKHLIMKEGVGWLEKHLIMKEGVGWLGKHLIMKEGVGWLGKCFFVSFSAPERSALPLATEGTQESKKLL